MRIRTVLSTSIYHLQASGFTCRIKASSSYLALAKTGRVFTGYISSHFSANLVLPVYGIYLTLFLSMAITEIKGFFVLPVKLPEASSPHYIFFKKHDGKSSSGNSANNNANRSIFFVNLPINTSTALLKKYFQNVAIGSTIESYTPSILTDYAEDIWVDLTKLTSDLELNQQENVEAMSKLPKNCGIATFVDKASFLLAFNALKKLASSSTETSWPINDTLTLGSSYFLSKYQAQILDTEEISNIVSQALIDFDRAEKESMESLQQQTQLVDEDGFTLVVGSHRKTKAGIMGKQKLAATVEVDKAKSTMKKKEKEDFYRFQLRQRKKDEMNDLLKKFKLDQEKVRLMKEKKRFRPY